MPLSTPITASDVNTQLDAQSANLRTNAKKGQRDVTVAVRTAALASGTAVRDRSVAFVPPDDMELRVLGVRCDSPAAADTATVTLTQTDGDSDYLLNQTVSASVTSVVGVANARVDYRTVSGTRLMLLKGVRYTLTITYSNVVASTEVVGTMLLRTRRRRA